MARAIGLDIGTRMVKVVDLAGTPKSPKVQRLIIRTIPEIQPPEEGAEPVDPDAALAALLRDVFETLKLPKDDVCACLDSSSTVFREIMVPFKEDDQIRKVVTFEAENHLHSHAIEDVIVNWVKTGQTQDGSRLTIFASPKQHLAERITLIKAAGIEPASMDLDVTAIYTACDAGGVFVEHPNVVVFDIGAHSTSIMLVAAGRPIVMRSFLAGAEQVERRVGQELHVGASEARRHARLAAGPREDDLFVPVGTLAPPVEETEKSLRQLQADVVADRRHAFVSKIHREALRSLASLRAEDAPARILVCGGGSLLPGLTDALAEKFGLPVEPLDLTRRFDFKDAGEDPALAAALTPVALGCGLRMLGHNPLGIELLRDEFAPTNTFDVVKNALAVVVTLLFAIFLGLAVSAKQRWDAEQQRFAHAAGKAEQLFKTAETAYYRKVENKTEADAKSLIASWLRRQPAGPDRARAYLRRLEGRYRSLASELGLAGDVPAIRSALEFWLEVHRALDSLDAEAVAAGKQPAAYGRWFRIMKMDVKRRTATVRLEVEDVAAFDRVREQIIRSPYFRERARDLSEIVSTGAQRTVNEYVQMDFNFRMKDED
jgi:type IV pilus assembly protein PilM